MKIEKENQLKAYQSNNLVEASYHMTLDEKRIILLCLGKIDSRGNVPSEVIVTAEEFAKAYSTDIKSAYAQIQDAAKTLYDRSILIKEPDKKRRTQMRWVGKVVYYYGRGEIGLFFYDEVKQYLGNLKSNFTGLALNEIKDFKSVYSIRFYELLIQFKKTGNRTVEVEWLRTVYLDLGDKYPLFNSFRVRVINPAIREINAKSNLIVTWEPIKRGRTIHKISFTFSEKTQKDLFE